VKRNSGHNIRRAGGKLLGILASMVLMLVMLVDLITFAVNVRREND
jgi:hypothetical protein